MTPYPLIYCPPGIEKPACCPHAASLAILPGAGPDCVVGGAKPLEQPGTCWGGPIRPGDEMLWTRSPAGWWLGMDGQRPQDLARQRTHPGILWWNTIPGLAPDHYWRVPVLLVPVEDAGEGTGYISAMDRVWSGKDWQTPSDLDDLVQPLMAIAIRTPLHVDEDERNAAIRTLAVGLLAQGHWIDEFILTTNGWLSEQMMINIVGAALRRPQAAD